MKYNQPADQPSSPNAPYIDGNPSAGIQGSIVPAASIEFPQRELMNLISACGLAGTNSDLSQLLQAVKNVDVCNILKNSINYGNASNWQGQVPPLPNGTNFPIGTALWFCPGQPSLTGGTTFSLNGSPPARVTLTDRSPVFANDVPSGYTWVLLFWDGQVWQIVAGVSRMPGQIVSLFSNATWFVNAITGSDSLYDGTQPAIIGAHGPFQSIQRAVNETTKYNMNGYVQYIYVADFTTGGQYAPVALPQTNGSGLVYLIGNTQSPGNVPVYNGNQYGTAIYASAGNYAIQGFRCSSAPNGYDGLTVTGGRISVVGNMQFGPCGRFHMAAGSGGYMSLGNIPAPVITIEAGATAGYHIETESAGSFGISWMPFGACNLVVQGPTNLVCFLGSRYAANFIGYYSQVTGAANVTAQKYVASMNGCIGCIGQGSAWMPGNTAGTTDSGGQFQT